MSRTTEIEMLGDLARDFEPDLHYAALLGPSEAQRDLIVLAAYVAETGRISISVQEPSLAEIRVQWWRDALLSAGSGTKSGNPILDQLAEVLSRHGIDAGDALNPLETVSREIEGEPFHCDQDLSLFLDQGSGSIARMALKISGGDAALKDEASLAFTNASRTIGAIRLARRLPELVQHGRGPFPPGSKGLREGMSEIAVRGEVAAASQVLSDLARAHLKKARAGLDGLSRAQRVAIVPVALTAPYAAKLTSPTRNALQDRTDIAPLNRLLRLWWFARTGRT